MDIYERMIREYERYNPHTATGADLDTIGRMMNLEREITEWLESDREYRTKILEELNNYFQENLTLED